jgi:hypothetical protein
MLFFKKRVAIEDFVADLVARCLPPAIRFFNEENGRAQQPVGLPEASLKEIGAGMVLLFIASRFPEQNKSVTDLMQRGYKAARRGLVKIGGNGDQAHYWWKAFADGQIMYGDNPPLWVACKVVWDRNFQNRPFQEQSALRAFGYFLQMQVDSLDKVKLV